MNLKKRKNDHAGGFNGKKKKHAIINLRKRKKLNIFGNMA